MTGTEGTEGNHILTVGTGVTAVIKIPLTTDRTAPGTTARKETMIQTVPDSLHPGTGTTRGGTVMQKDRQVPIPAIQKKDPKTGDSGKMMIPGRGIHVRKGNLTGIAPSANRRMITAAPGGGNAHGLQGLNQMPPARAHQRMTGQPG